jgi:hypothetical protein
VVHGCTAAGKWGLFHSVALGDKTDHDVIRKRGDTVRIVVILGDDNYRAISEPLPICAHSEGQPIAYADFIWWQVTIMT